MPPSNTTTEATSEGGDPEAWDRLRRRVLWSMPTGLYVIGSRAGDRANLMTANLVMQVSIEPKMVAVAVESDSTTRELVEASGMFSVCILDRSQRPLVRRFVKPVERVERDPDGSVISLGGERVHEKAGGVPVLEACSGWLACRLRQAIQPGGSEESPGSHQLMIGEVIGAGLGGAGDAASDGGPIAGPSAPSNSEVLRMEDTRMHYGG